MSTSLYYEFSMLEIKPLVPRTRLDWQKVYLCAYMITQLTVLSKFLVHITGSEVRWCLYNRADSQRETSVITPLTVQSKSLDLK